LHLVLDNYSNNKKQIKMKITVEALEQLEQVAQNTSPLKTLLPKSFY